jgi:hypothetical protein
MVIVADLGAMADWLPAEGAGAAAAGGRCGAARPRRRIGGGLAPT